MEKNHKGAVLSYGIRRRLDILTIRNIKCVPLGECVFNVHGLRFDCQVELISVLSHTNLVENI